jgi:hypothetical protein
MKKPVVLDWRNVFDLKEMKERGFISSGMNPLILHLPLECPDWNLSTGTFSLPVATVYVHTPSFFLKYSIVFFSPSDRFTRGSH